MEFTDGRDCETYAEYEAGFSRLACPIPELRLTEEQWQVNRNSFMSETRRKEYVAASRAAVKALIEAADEAMEDANRQVKADAPGVMPDWGVPLGNALKTIKSLVCGNCGSGPVVGQDSAGTQLCASCLVE